MVDSGVTGTKEGMKGRGGGYASGTGRVRHKRWAVGEGKEPKMINKFGAGFLARCLLIPRQKTWA